MIFLSPLKHDRLIGIMFLYVSLSSSVFVVRVDDVGGVTLWYSINIFDGMQ